MEEAENKKRERYAENEGEGGRQTEDDKVKERGGMKDEKRLRKQDSRKKKEQ